MAKRGPGRPKRPLLSSKPDSVTLAAGGKEVVLTAETGKKIDRAIKAARRES